MISGILHTGSGMGNQFHRIVASKCLALDKGYEWGMINPVNFKGSSFMNLDLGLPSLLALQDNPKFFQEKKVVENGVDIRGYDPEFNFIEDNTIIDGEFQDERYWAHREKEVDEWLTVEPIDIPDDLCVIGFRGGEFSIFPDLFLTKEYWKEAMEMMRDINPMMRFEVHTDDPETARKFFTMDIKIIHDIGINWCSMRYAKYAIIANSSFYILPRWLRNGVTIAPKGWARHNWKDGGWYLPQNYYSRFKYI